MTTPSLLTLSLSLAAATSSPAPASAGSSNDDARPPQYEAARAATIVDPPREGVELAIQALYRTISGPKGQSRDRRALEALLHPDVRFMFAEQTAEGGVALRTLGRDAFLAYTTPLWESGFFESEVAREMVHYGRVAHVWSTYETRRTEGGPVVARGINSFQLFFDGQRWQVVTAYWQGERKELPIPARFLATP